MVEGKKLTASIADALLAEAQRFALIFPRGVAKDPAFFLYFFEVMRRFPLHLVLTLPEIPAGGKVDFGYLTTAGITVKAEESVFSVGSERVWRIYHLGIGIRPSELRLYRAIPAGTTAGGFAYAAPTVVGDDWDFISGDLSPFEEPTLLTETVVYHNISVTLGLLNETNRVMRPRLRLLGAGYDTIGLKNEGLIEKMLSGRLPCRFLTVASLAFFSYTAPKEWGKATLINARKLEQILAERKEVEEVEEEEEEEVEEGQE